MPTLLERAAAITVRASDLRKEAKALSEKPELSADESGHLDELLAEADKADQEAEGLRARAERLRANEAALEGYARPGARRTAVGAGEDPLVAKPAFLADPKRGYSDVGALLKDMRRARASGRPSKQLLSLVPSSAYLLGGEVEAAAGSDEHSGFYDPALGVMVPAALLPGVLSTPAPEDPFPDTMRVPINVPVLEILARVDKDHSTSVSGGFRVYRRAETGTVTASRGNMEKISLRADELMGVSFSTNELEADAPGLVSAMIEAGFRDEFAGKRVEEIISGDGVGRNLGFGNSANAAKIDVAKETGQVAATIVYENLIKMLARLWGAGRWVANKTCIPQLAKLNGGTNGLIWQPSAREGLPGTLLGMPITFTEYCAALGTVGDLCLVNMSQYIEVIRQDVQTEQSIHVRFLENENCYRFTARRGGAPWWRSVLTPKNGDTLAPFVRLATRS